MNEELRLYLDYLENQNGIDALLIIEQQKSIEDSELI